MRAVRLADQSMFETSELLKASWESSPGKAHGIVLRAADLLGEAVLQDSGFSGEPLRRGASEFPGECAAAACEITDIDSRLSSVSCSNIPMLVIGLRGASGNSGSWSLSFPLESMVGVPGRDGDSVGHSRSSTGSIPPAGEIDRRKGFSLASSRERLMKGEVGLIVATGRLGRGLSSNSKGYFRAVGEVLTANTCCNVSECRRLLSGLRTYSRSFVAFSRRSGYVGSLTN